MVVVPFKRPRVAPGRRETIWRGPAARFIPNGEENMSDHGRMQVEHSLEQMWTLSEDRRSIRLQLPPLPIVGIPKPLDVFTSGPA
jgi:hypothetical protein